MARTSVCASLVAHIPGGRVLLSSGLCCRGIGLSLLYQRLHGGGVEVCCGRFVDGKSSLALLSPKCGMDPPLRSLDGSPSIALFGVS